MNRPIKFRAWVKFKSGEYKMLDNLDMWSVGELRAKNESEKIMQFTGLLDKNGKEIYEGDIVTFSDAIENKKVVIEYIAPSFRYTVHGGKVDGITFDLIGWSTWEIIGNIYENPELLK